MDGRVLSGIADSGSSVVEVDGSGVHVIDVNKYIECAFLSNKTQE